MPEKITVENILPMSNTGGERLKGEPEVVLNLDAFSNQVEKRQGRTLLASLSNCHSLQAVDNYFLAGATGSLYSRALWMIDSQGVTTELAELPDLNKLYYKIIGEKVYISSRTKSLIFNKETMVVEDWGIEIPKKGPSVTIMGGALPSGKYSLVFTRSVAGEISGAGLVTTIELKVAGGLSVSNMDSDFSVWITEPNGVKFFYSGTSPLIQRPPGGEILPTLDVTPPDGLENLLFFKGRIFGSRNKKMLYSDSYAFNWFRGYNSFDFKSNILMLAEDDKGIYIGTKDVTYFQSGNDIREMSLDEIGGGVIKGTLVYAPVGDGDIRVPVWASKEGIFAGVGGKAKSLTDDRLNMSLAGEGAAFFRYVKGNIQLGVNAPSEGTASISDKVTVKVFREGRIINATYNEFVRDNIAVSGTLT